MPQLVIVTDLDGSLLDHHTYSHAAADACLQRLEASGVPVVLCTSKTRAEVLPLRTELGNRHPFIVENGAAVFVPKDYFATPLADCQTEGEWLVYELCPPRRHWLDLLQQAKPLFPNCFDHFANMSAERVAELTGLSPEEAQRARQRGYGEPLQWLASDQELARFTDWAEARGARVLRGGRFVHLAGQSDKGRALAWLVAQYRRHWAGREVVSLALGDGHNDVDMLARANLAVVIRSPVHEPPRVTGKRRLITSEALGPEGWVEGVEHWLAYLDGLAE